MNPGEYLRLAFRALATNKLRSALTMLGIIIGVGAVITLLSVGRGVQNLVTDQLQSVGTNLLFVVPGSLEESNGPRGGSASNAAELTLADAEAIADPLQAPDVTQVAPEVISPASVSFGGTTLNLSISGVTPAYEDVRNFPVAYGSFITDSDVDARTRALLSSGRVWPNACSRITVSTPSARRSRSTMCRSRSSACWRRKAAAAGSAAATRTK